MGHQWVASLASCNFSVQYREGITHTEADGLSHMDWGSRISAESVQAIFNVAMEGMSPLADICAHSAQAYLSLQKQGMTEGPCP